MRFEYFWIQITFLWSLNVFDDREQSFNFRWCSWDGENKLRERQETRDRSVTSAKFWISLGLFLQEKSLFVEFYPEMKTKEFQAFFCKKLKSLKLDPILIKQIEWAADL